MRNIQWKSAVGVGVLLLMNAGWASADAGSWSVVRYGSTTPKDVYAWDEAPCVYLPIPYNPLYNPVSEHVEETWLAPSGAKYHIWFDAYLGDRWLIDYLPGNGLSGSWWTVREAGNWTVNSSWRYNYDGWQGGVHDSSAKFEIIPANGIPLSAPEPASLSILAVSGLALLGRRRAIR